VLLHEFLEESADAYLNKIALVQKEERWTYRAIDEKANQVAYLLRNQGIQRGDRVAILLDNSVGGGDLPLRHFESGCRISDAEFAPEARHILFNPSQAPIQSAVMKNNAEFVKATEKALFEPLYEKLGNEIKPYFLGSVFLEHPVSSPTTCILWQSLIMVKKRSMDGSKSWDGNRRRIPTPIQLTA
jgi:acyl-CoA synthetase (AMP-forming)/AMP-acid ligase II